MNKCDEIKYLPSDKDTITSQDREIFIQYFGPIDDSFSNFIHPIVLGIFVFLIINRFSTSKLETIFDKNTIFIQTFFIMFTSFIFLKYLP